MMWIGSCRWMAPSGESLWITSETAADVLSQFVGNNRSESVHVLAQSADLVHLGLDGADGVGFSSWEAPGRLRWWSWNKPNSSIPSAHRSTGQPLTSNPVTDQQQPNGNSVFQQHAFDYTVHTHRRFKRFKLRPRWALSVVGLLPPNLIIRGHLPAPIINGEKVAFKNGRISDFQGLVTLIVNRVTLHTIMCHSSTSTYITNVIEIEETFCGRMDGHLRPTLCRLRGVDLKMMQLKSPNLTQTCSTMSPVKLFILGSKGQRSRSQGTKSCRCESSEGGLLLFFSPLTTRHFRKQWSLNSLNGWGLYQMSILERDQPCHSTQQTPSSDPVQGKSVTGLRITLWSSITVRMTDVECFFVPIFSPKSPTVSKERSGLTWKSEQTWNVGLLAIGGLDADGHDGVELQQTQGQLGLQLALQWRQFWWVLLPQLSELVVQVEAVLRQTLMLPAQLNTQQTTCQKLVTTSDEVDNTVPH